MFDREICSGQRLGPRLLRRGERVRRSPRALASVALVLVSSALLALGCGSSKPAYCGKITELEKATNEVKSATNAEALASGLKKSRTTTEELLKDLKNEYQTQANAIRSSLNALVKSIEQLNSAQTRSAAAAQIPGQLTAFENSVESLSKEVKGKCK